MIRLHRAQDPRADGQSHFNPMLSDDDRVIYVNPAHIIVIEPERNGSTLHMDGQPQWIEVAEYPELVLEAIRLSEVSR